MDTSKLMTAGQKNEGRRRDSSNKKKKKIEYFHGIGGGILRFAGRGAVPGKETKAYLRKELSHRMVAGASAYLKREGMVSPRSR